MGKRIVPDADSFVRPSTTGVNTAPAIMPPALPIITTIGNTNLSIPKTGSLVEDNRDTINDLTAMIGTTVQDRFNYINNGYVNPATNPNTTNVTGKSDTTFSDTLPKSSDWLPIALVGIVGFVLLWKLR